MGEMIRKEIEWIAEKILVGMCVTTGGLLAIAISEAIFKWPNFK